MESIAQPMRSHCVRYALAMRSHCPVMRSHHSIARARFPWPFSGGRTAFPPLFVARWTPVVRLPPSKEGRTGSESQSARRGRHLAAWRLRTLQLRGWRGQSSGLRSAATSNKASRDRPGMRSRTAGECGFATCPDKTGMLVSGSKLCPFPPVALGAKALEIVFFVRTAF